MIALKITQTLLTVYLALVLYAVRAFAIKPDKRNHYFIEYDFWGESYQKILSHRHVTNRLPSANK